MPPRSHPWTTTAAEPAHRYYDLRAQPELIPTVLEDFRPWDRHAAVQDFYRLIADINGPASALESNDCAFSGPEPSTMPGVTKRLQCSGRVGVLFRDLVRNTDARATKRFVLHLHRRLATNAPGFEGGAIGTSQLVVDYRGLPASASTGTQTLIWFWAWGDQPTEVFANLAEVVAGLSAGLIVKGAS